MRFQIPVEIMKYKLAWGFLESGEFATQPVLVVTCLVSIARPISPISGHDADLIIYENVVPVTPRSKIAIVAIG